MQAGPPRDHPRLRRWWIDDPSNPGRIALGDPRARRLMDAIAPGSPVTDLGGVMSLNAHLHDAGLVLRVHQPCVSRDRLLAAQRVRQVCAVQGTTVPRPAAWRGGSVIRSGDRWAELDPYVPHQRLAPSAESYRWLFAAMGALHRVLAPLRLPVPGPVVATYGVPGSLRTWLSATSERLRHEREAAPITAWLGEVVRTLQRTWIPARQLPTHLVHGDVRLSNVCVTGERQPVYFDFGFLAYRARIHEVAYALAYAKRFAWALVPDLVGEYEAHAESRLGSLERRALAPYTAAVPLYHAALAGFSDHPLEGLREKRRFAALSHWVLTHPDALAG